MQCKEKAWQWVRLAMAGAVPLTLVPMPGFATTSLTALEVALVYQVARIYGVPLTQIDLTVLAGTLGVGSVALKAGMAELVGLVPVAGWACKALVAPSVVMTVGRLAVRHFEDRYPGRVFTSRDHPVEIRDLVKVPERTSAFWRTGL